MRWMALCAAFASLSSTGCFGSGDDRTNPLPVPFDAGIGVTDGGGNADATTGSDSGRLDASTGDAGGDATASLDGGCAGGGPGTFTCTGSLATPRIAPGGAILTSGQVLVAGGWNAVSQTLTSAELYDPASGTFSPTGAMASGHLWAGWASPWPVLASGKPLVAGGLDATGALLASTELYNPVDGTFTATGSLGTPVIAFNAVTLQSASILFIGGYSAVTGSPPTPGWEYTAGTNQVQAYDPAMGMFSGAGTLGEPRLFGCNVVLPSGKVLAIGGWVGAPATFEPNIEQYDPGSGQWTTVGTLPDGALCGAAAAVLPGGQVLLDGSYLLDPTAFTAIPTTNTLTFDAPQSAQLTNGDVLAFGGTKSGVAVADVEVYRVATGLWTPVGSLHQPRSGCRGFLLTGGEVLVVGGSDASGAALATAEIYHP